MGNPFKTTLPVGSSHVGWVAGRTGTGVAGRGLTVTVTVNVPPAQVPDGVTVYVAVAGEPDVFVSVPLMPVEPLPVVPPEKPEPVGNPQLYVVPAGTIPSGPLTGVTVNGTPLHSEVVKLLIAALGFTVTVTVKGVPEQLPDKGVTV